MTHFPNYFHVIKTTQYYLSVMSLWLYVFILYICYIHFVFFTSLNNVAVACYCCCCWCLVQTGWLTDRLTLLVFKTNDSSVEMLIQSNVVQPFVNVHILRLRQLNRFLQSFHDFSSHHKVFANIYTYDRTVHGHKHATKKIVLPATKNTEKQ